MVINFYELWDPNLSHLLTERDLKLQLIYNYVYQWATWGICGY